MTQKIHDHSCMFRAVERGICAFWSVLLSLSDTGRDGEGFAVRKKDGSAGCQIRFRRVAVFPDLPRGLQLLTPHIAFGSGLDAEFPDVICQPRVNLLPLPPSRGAP